MRVLSSVSRGLAVVGLLLASAASACSSASSSSGTSDGTGGDSAEGTGAGTSGATSTTPELAGTYKAATSGPLAEITFFAPARYALLRGPCDDQAEDCDETGTYALDAAATTLTLTPDDGGAPSELPFQTLLADDSESGATVTTESSSLAGERALRPDGLVSGSSSLVCDPHTGPLVQVATVSGQQIVQSGVGSPSSGWPGCSGSFDTHGSPTGSYFVTDFGCSSSPSFTDPDDNCCGAGVAAAASQGLCAAGTSTSGCTSSTGTSASIACERAVNWFSTGGSAFGRGTRLRLTGSSGKQVVVFVIDDGPACYRERAFGGFALDVSYPTAIYLFGEQVGTSDRAVVHVDVVDASTPLGPSTGGTSPADAGSPSSGSDGGTTVPGAPTCPPSASCHSDGDCNPGSNGSGLICTSGKCVAGCRSSAQCPGVSTCSGGQCTGGATSPTSPTSPTAPTAPTSPTAPTKPTSPGNASCSNDGACNPGNNGAGLVCSGGTCTPGCKANWYCPGIQTCRSGQCQ
jgi:hypothetical protein